MASFWRSGIDYDIGSASAQLSEYMSPFFSDKLSSDALDGYKPLLVDFGCWSGRHLRLLERVAAQKSQFDTRDRVIGIDEIFAKPRLEEARRAYKEFEIWDKGIANTGLPASSVDGAISWRVLHNLIQPGEITATVSEIKRVLKHDAPFIISVRATKDWMQQDAPIPLQHRSYTLGTERDDFYFSENACYAMFNYYGFDIPFKAKRFTEEEVVDGVRISNDYWMLCLVNNKRREKLLAKPMSIEPPVRSLDKAYSLST